VEARLRALEVQRLRAEEEVRLQAELARLRSHPRHLERQAHGAVRVERALEAAGARLLDTRRLGSERLEVTFGFMGERFISIVDASTLQVVDAGICLAGADREVTLESLPSVIREAIEDDVLVITRHA
jgi:plasmid stabilization system protein ParE